MFIENVLFNSLNVKYSYYAIEPLEFERPPVAAANGIDFQLFYIRGSWDFILFLAKCFFTVTNLEIPTQSTTYPTLQSNHRSSYVNYLSYLFTWKNLTNTMDITLILFCRYFMILIHLLIFHYANKRAAILNNLFNGIASEIPPNTR